MNALPNSSATNNRSAALYIESVRVRDVTMTNISLNDAATIKHFQKMLDRLGRDMPRRRKSSQETRFPQPLPLASPARTLSVEVHDYLQSCERRHLQANSIKAYDRTLQLLKVACGDVLVSDIGRDHIGQWWELLKWAPKHLSIPTLAGKTAQELIAIGQQQKRKPLARRTLSAHHTNVSAFFSALVLARAIPYSPMDAFPKPKLDVTTEEESSERWFSEDDLKRVFDHDTFKKWAKKYPHRWWAPMIGLYTGARIGEVAQIKTADVSKIHGVWCLSIRKTVDADLAHKSYGRSRQRLKNQASQRTIVIAQPLIDAGFLDFVADLKEAKCKRLFPHLSAGQNRISGETNARYSQGLLNQFGAYMKKLGFPDGMRFHSFRHTLITSLDNDGVGDKEICMISGHALRVESEVLGGNYRGKIPERIIATQVKTLARYKPAVVLPVYQKGQFEKQLKDRSKHYP